MRRVWTTLLIVAVAAVGIAALVDALAGRPSEPRSVLESATERAPSTTAPLPVCEPGQLSLRLEVLGGTNVAALRHVGGPPCQASDLRLRVYITTDGERSEIPFGQESVLDGAMSPSVERLVPFSICLAEPRLTAEAVAAVPDGPLIDLFEGIASLVDQSLLRPMAGAGGAPRNRPPTRR